jgi:hypothetical protein
LSNHKIGFLIQRERFTDAINTLRVVNKFTHDNLIREITTEKEICDHGKLALSDYSGQVYEDITRLCEEELILIEGYQLDGYPIDVVTSFYSRTADRTLDALQSSLPINHGGICPVCSGHHEIKPLARGIMEDYLNIAIAVEANLMREISEELNDELLIVSYRLEMDTEAKGARETLE